MPSSDDDFEVGHRLFESFVRGDAMIGLIADVPGTERSMTDALWRAAGRGMARAYRVIGDCYLAYLRPMGAFEGIAPEDAEGRAWSDGARAIVDGDSPALEAAMRAYHEAGALGDREAVIQVARLTRQSNEGNRRRALALLEGLGDPSPAEIYQRGLVQNWLSELEQSAQSHLLAAEGGNSDAKFELYIYYAQGLGVVADADESEAWLMRAAEDGHPRALYSVGAAYASGAKGEPDVLRAADFYERAAQRGNGRAAATLALMILTGEIEGTEERAIDWLDLADEQGFPSWEMLDAMGVEDPREE